MKYSDLVFMCALGRIFDYDCRLALKLMEMFPSPETLFTMGESGLTDIFGPDSPYVSHLMDGKILEDASKEVEWAEKKGVRVLCYSDSDYPRRLKECPDAPLVLFLAGTADINSERIISIVGTRKATTYGLDICRKIVDSLADLTVKPLIVSGLAYGIDICAHREALESGLSTLGVMATGVNEIYPSPHRADAVAMCSGGGIISEYWRGAPPNKYNFIRRNRIIAGLCDAIVLVESDRNGGGVVTSKMAFSYERDVLAVPGRLSDRWSSGCNEMISSKMAESVPSPEKVAELLGWRSADSFSREECLKIFSSDSAVTRNIIVALSNNSEMDADMIADRTGTKCQDIMKALTLLEMDGRIVSDDRGRFRLKKQKKV